MVMTEEVVLIESKGPCTCLLQPLNVSPVGNTCTESRETWHSCEKNLFSKVCTLFKVI